MWEVRIRGDRGLRHSVAGGVSRHSPNSSRVDTGEWAGIIRLPARRLRLTIHSSMRNTHTRGLMVCARRRTSPSPHPNTHNRQRQLLEGTTHPPTAQSPRPRINNSFPLLLASNLNLSSRRHSATVVVSKDSSRDSSTGSKAGSRRLRLLGLRHRVEGILEVGGEVGLVGLVVGRRMEDGVGRVRGIVILGLA